MSAYSQEETFVAERDALSLQEAETDSDYQLVLLFGWQSLTVG